MYKKSRPCPMTQRKRKNKKRHRRGQILHASTLFFSRAQLLPAEKEDKKKETHEATPPSTKDAQEAEKDKQIENSFPRDRKLFVVAFFLSVCLSGGFLEVLLFSPSLVLCGESARAPERKKLGLLVVSQCREDQRPRGLKKKTQKKCDHKRRCRQRPVSARLNKEKKSRAV
ncbi:hypothetical protein pneo_cds_2 [Pandoravirus neocaledonia]|uniref:Transmembrane protein n=1 Tax=Pandoravirus neocaledonia TaxID=2107708 RepID=A0A2U7UAZ5_9VIRU|nr:hypothetical protein pneo_cds_2 [Pandoravirus neocaledonia]AVK75609.1 hypothetical protein pneo_cds_2 [Pandoravirus neocaledonia]